MLFKLPLRGVGKGTMLLHVLLLGEALSEILTACKFYKCQRWFSTKAELHAVSTILT